MIKTAVFASGKGSNFEAIAAYFKDSKDIEISLLVCDNKDALVIPKAEQLGIETLLCTSKEFKTRLSEAEEIELVRILKKKNIDLIVLAGYMRIVKKPLLEAFSSRILNIHPSLLPAHKGLNPVKRALAAKDSYTGCTVHMVTPDIDEGEILGQKKVKINSDDTEESLTMKIHQAEHKLYPEVIEKIILRIKQ